MKEGKILIDAYVNVNHAISITECLIYEYNYKQARTYFDEKMRRDCMLNLKMFNMPLRT